MTDSKKAVKADVATPSPPLFRGIHQLTAERRSVVAGGIKTSFWDQGSGEPIVLVHGSGAGVSAAVNWYANIEPLAGSFRVLAPDLVGFGDTEPDPEGNYGIDRWVEHLVAFMDAVGLESAHLVGNSLGGWVATELARTHPSRVRRLVLMGTGGTPESMTPRLRSNQTYKPDRDRMREVLLGFVVAPEIITDELIDYRFELTTGPGAVEVYGATTQARNRDREQQPLTPARVAGVGCETLLIHGREDRIIPAASSWNLAQSLAAAHLVVLARCGHWSQIEHARRFNLLVEDFVSWGLDGS